MAKTQSLPAEPPILSNSFGVTISEIRGGRLQAELSDKLAKLVGSVRDHNKGGTLTLTLKIEPVSRVDAETLMVTDKVTVKSPEPERHGVIFYPTDQNTLQRNDPRQAELPLREVTGGKAEARDVPEEPKAKLRSV